MTAPCVCCNVAGVSIAPRFLLSSTFQCKVLSMIGLTGNHSTAARVFARVPFVDKPIGPLISVFCRFLNASTPTLPSHSTRSRRDFSNPEHFGSFTLSKLLCWFRRGEERRKFQGKTVGGT